MFGVNTMSLAFSMHPLWLIAEICAAVLPSPAPMAMPPPFALPAPYDSTIFPSAWSVAAKFTGAPPSSPCHRIVTASAALST